MGVTNILPSRPIILKCINDSIQEVTNRLTYQAPPISLSASTGTIQSVYSVILATTLFGIPLHPTQIPQIKLYRVYYVHSLRTL